MPQTTETEGWYDDQAATFGDRLTDARLKAGLTEAELATRLGVDEQSIRDWEQDIAEPAPNRLQMVSGLLNVSVGWLMTGAGAGVAPPASDHEPDGQALMAEVAELRAGAVALARKLGAVERRLRAAMRLEG